MVVNVDFERELDNFIGEREVQPTDASQDSCTEASMFRGALPLVATNLEASG